MLGGTPILIDPGVPLQSTDKVTCKFGGNEEEGIRINDTLALCVSPSLQHSGFVPFTLEIADRPPQESQFLSGKHTCISTHIHTRTHAHTRTHTLLTLGGK